MVGLLDSLNNNSLLSDKLSTFFEICNSRFEFLDRISVAIYDERRGNFKTLLDTEAGLPVMSNYEVGSDFAPSLMAIANQQTARVVDDLCGSYSAQSPHGGKIVSAGYRSSYTLPMILDERLYGFIFFNSRRTSQFTPTVLQDLEPLAHLLSMTVISDLRSARTLSGAVSSLRKILALRDYETGTHLERMSDISLIIGRELAAAHNLTDEFLEFLFRFSPMHDIGKITVPDRILLKPGALDADEWEVMRRHASNGLRLVDSILCELELERMAGVDVLRNIVQYHHENFDGSGYPFGLAGADIPIEARIVATADRFDALTSPRLYKRTWSNEEAFKFLLCEAGAALDRECVNALIVRRSDVEAAQLRARESDDPFE